MAYTETTPDTSAKRDHFHPETDFFDCRPFLYGITETCKIRNPRRGAWGIGVHNYAATPGEPYTIKARHVK